MNPVNPAIQERKADLRRQVQAGLKHLSSDARAAGSRQACARLKEQRAWVDAGTVLLYSPLPDELDVESILQEALRAGKNLTLPGFDPAKQAYLARRVLDLEADLRPGRFGISEPNARCPEVALNQLDFVVAPGVAFTLDGRRLGRGKGYYDRLLASVGGVKCGIAFEEQIVDAIPSEPHDICMDFLLTPARWLRVDRGAVLK